MKTRFKAVIFDIDGTLTAANSWNVITQELGADIYKHHQIYIARKANAITLEKARELLLQLWVNTGNANEKFIGSIFKKTILRKGARQIFSYLHKRNYSTCLITGSNNIFAQEVAKKLNTNHFYSNCTFYFDKNGSLKTYDYDIEQGKRKLIQLTDFCKKQKINISACVVVGDSANDIEIFEATGHGIAIKTEDEEVEIEKVAWRKINKLEELEKIL